MRLICGVVDLESIAPCVSSLQRMCDALQSADRPAQIQTWTGQHAAFAVLDFEAANGVPEMQLDDHVLVADLRLDYVEELRAGLKDGAQKTEAGLVTAILAQSEPQAPRALFGDFACALWTPKKQEVLLVRDAMGVRPLCYSIADSRILFASFPRAIIASGLIEKRLDTQALLHKAAQNFLPGRTFFTGIHWLEAGCSLRWSSGMNEMHRYWQAESQPRRYRTPQQAAAELRRLTEEAVRSRLPKHGPVAAHLSGGLDSTAIAMIAARTLRLQGRALYGYSFLASPEARAHITDETPFVQAALDQESSIISVPVYPSTKAERHYLPDELLMGDGSHPEQFICRDAREKGAALIFSGWGGDEGVTYNGRAALADAFVHLRWMYLVREMRAMHLRRGTPYRQLLRADLLGNLLGQRMISWVHRLRPRGIPSGNFEDYLQPEYRTDLRKGSLKLEARASVRKNQLELLRSAHLSARCVHWTMYGASAGVAFTFPFLDRRLVEFALSLPPTWQLCGGFRRRVLRDAMEGILPELVRWRDNKLLPFPPGPANRPVHDADIAAMLERAQKNIFLRCIFNLPKLRAATLQAETRQGQGRSRSVKNVLAALRFIDQNFTDTPTDA